MRAASFYRHCALVLLALTMALTTAPAAATDDTTPPVLTSISRAGTGPFAPGSQVSFNYSATDAGGVASVSIDLSWTSSEDGSDTISVTGSGAAGVAQGPIPGSWGAGVVMVDYIEVMDAAGNSSIYGADGSVDYFPNQGGPTTHSFDFEALGFEVQGGTGDTTPPVLSEFDFTPKNLDVSTGAKDVTVTARVTDATGTNAPTIALRPETGSGLEGVGGTMTLTSGNATNGVYTATVSIPATATPGNWTVRVHPLSDTLGNTETGPHVHPTKLTVLNGGGGTDTAAPELSEFSFTPHTVDVTTAAKSVTVTARVTDASGANPPTVVLDADSSTQTFGGPMALEAGGSATNGVYKRTVSIPTDATAGTWTVRIDALSDTAGNTQPGPNNHGTKLTVVKGGGGGTDTAAPALSEFDFTPKDVDVTTGAKEVTVTARVTDATGANAPTVYLDSDTSSQILGSGPMTRSSGDTKNGVYSRTISIPSTAASGSWTVIITPLTDTLGNAGTTVHAHQSKLTVTSAGADDDAPVLSDFDFNPKSADVSTGAKTVTVTARVTDDTGAVPPTLVLDSDTTDQTLGVGAMNRVSGDAKDGVYTSTVTIPTAAANGTWSVLVNPLADTLGNAESSAHTHPTKLAVTSVEADDDAPAVSEFDFTPKTVDLGVGGQSVEVTARLVDATGAERPVLVLESDTTGQTLGLGEMDLSTGDPKNGVYTRTVTIPAGAATGAWSVVIEPVSDILGNTAGGPEIHPTKLAVNGTSTGAAPSAPTGVSATPGNKSAIVSWTAPSSGGPITGYTVSASPGNAVVAVAGDRTNIKVRGLSNGKKYTFTVTATNEHGTSAASMPSAPVKPATVPGKVARPKVVVRTGRVILTWKAPASGGAKITGYRVWVNGAASDIPAKPRKLVARALEPGRYKVKIAAINRSGVGKASALVRFRIARP